MIFPYISKSLEFSEIFACSMDNRECSHENNNLCNKNKKNNWGGGKDFITNFMRCCFF